MDTMLIEVNSSKGMRLLKDLEDLKIIRVLEMKSNGKKTMSEKYEGKISKKTANALQKQIAESRKEWERNF